MTSGSEGGSGQPGAPIADVPPEEAAARARAGQGEIVLGVAFVLASAAYLATALGYDFGTVSQPGYGMFPVFVGVGALSTSLLATGAAVRARGRGGSGAGEPWPRGATLVRALAVIALTAFYIVALPLLGTFLVNALVGTGMLLSMGMRRWWAAILIAVGMAIGLQWLFRVVLMANLPGGLLEGIWIF